MGMVDAALLGRYDSTALAAASVGNSLLLAFSVVGLGVVMGLDTVLPQVIGARRDEDARRLLNAGLRLALISGGLAMLMVIPALIVIEVAAVDPEVARGARVYIALRALGIVPFLLSVALRSYLAARGNIRPLLEAVIVGNIVNAALDVVLIRGAGPIPALGIAGAALATDSVQVVCAIFYARSVRAIDGNQARPPSTREDLATIARFGFPVGGQLCAEAAIFGIAGVLAACLGSVPAAAHAVALNLSGFAFSIGMGIASAINVRVGLATGAGDRALARRRGLLGFTTSLTVMACFAVVFIGFPGPLASFFSDQSEVVVAARPVLRIAALFQLSDGTQAVAAGALRGLGDTRAAFICSVVGHYGVGLAISLSLAFVAGWGTPGLWLGLSAGFIVNGVYLCFRFHRLTAPAELGLR